MTAQPKQLIPFTPTAATTRHDGWTAQKQIAFIEALAETACVEHACRRVGMSDSSAYRLRLRHPAFEAAWNAALDHGLARLEQAVLARSLRGVARPIFYKGEQVGEWRHYDERLAMFLLRGRRPQRYGRWIERESAPDPNAPDAAMQVVAAMDDFEDADEPEPDRPPDSRQDRHRGQDQP